jgi:tRNA-splicing ligase RtcB (3'-phosphate/5'-hydroxy nucleic acid ligase)
MKALILTGSEILALGFPQGKVIGIIIRIVSENYTAEQKEYVMNLLRAIIKHPEKFRNHETYGEIVFELTGEVVYRKERVGNIAPHVNEDIVYGVPAYYA